MRSLPRQLLVGVLLLVLVLGWFGRARRLAGGAPGAGALPRGLSRRITVAINDSDHLLTHDLLLK
jgi:hypothetical protein